MKKSRFWGTLPEITEYSIVSEKIPAFFDNFRIAHISDTHSKPVDEIFELVKSQNPNIICLTGDLFHEGKTDAPKVWTLLRNLSDLAPVYLITGNHDLWYKNSPEIKEKIAKTGVVLLDGNMHIFERNGERIALFGVGDTFSKLPKKIQKNVSSQFENLPDFDGYKILLYHRANLFDLIKDFGFNLILSGHMHGGQIRTPHLGGLLAPLSSRFYGRMILPKYTWGEFVHKNTVMIVNRGCSNTLPIPRILNPSEVGIITLRHKNKA
ncbi:MAG: metallophosphoesterase [Clostridia bacterium]|nr:metallophosphoesterase [Clostridia bacterium]